MATQCKTDGCTRTYLGYRGHGRCNACVRDLRSRGLCAYCGVAPPSSSRAMYCMDCIETMRKEAPPFEQPEHREEGPQPKYRDSDAKENQYDTRRGG